MSRKPAPSLSEALGASVAELDSLDSLIADASGAADSEPTTPVKAPRGKKPPPPGGKPTRDSLAFLSENQTSNNTTTNNNNSKPPSKPTGAKPGTKPNKTPMSPPVGKKPPKPGKKPAGGRAGATSPPPAGPQFVLPATALPPRVPSMAVRDSVIVAAEDKRSKMATNPPPKPGTKPTKPASKPGKPNPNPMATGPPPKGAKPPKPSKPVKPKPRLLKPQIKIEQRRSFRGDDKAPPPRPDRPTRGKDAAKAPVRRPGAPIEEVKDVEEEEIVADDAGEQAEGDSLPTLSPPKTQSPAAAKAGSFTTPATEGIEGWLYTKWPGMSGWKRRYFKLAGQSLVFFAKDTSTEEVDGISIAGAQLRRRTDKSHKGRKTCFEILRSDKQTDLSYLLVAESEQAMFRWMTAITLQLEFRPRQVAKNPDFEGFLQELVENKSWVRRYYRLKDDQLYVFRDPQIDVKMAVIPLEGMSVQACKVTGKKNKLMAFTFAISDGGENNFVFCAEDERLMMGWISAISINVPGMATRPSLDPPSTMAGSSGDNNSGSGGGAKSSGGGGGGGGGSPALPPPRTAASKTPATPSSPKPAATTASKPTPTPTPTPAAAEPTPAPATTRGPAKGKAAAADPMAFMDDPAIKFDPSVLDEEQLFTALTEIQQAIYKEKRAMAVLLREQKSGSKDADKQVIRQHQAKIARLQSAQEAVEDELGMGADLDEAVEAVVEESTPVVAEFSTDDSEEEDLPPPVSVNSSTLNTPTGGDEGEVEADGNGDDGDYDEVEDDDEEGAMYVTALFSWQGSEDDDLSIEEGDIISVLEIYSDGWTRGVLHGKEGLFPTAYVCDPTELSESEESAES